MTKQRIGAFGLATLLGYLLISADYIKPIDLYRKM